MNGVLHFLTKKSNLFLAVVLITSWIVHNFGLIAYRTNDDVGLSAIASGAVTGTSEHALIFSSPLLGWILKTGYYAAPNFDWYGFTMFALQLSSILIISVAIWKTSSKAEVRFLKISILLFLLPRFLFPMQFTSAAVITVLAGVVTIFQPIHRPTQRSWKIFRGSCLIALGVGFRPEAGYLTLLVIGFCLFALIAFESLSVRRALLLKFALLPSIALGVLLTDRWNSAKPPDPGQVATAKVLSRQSPPNELADLDFHLLKSTAGLYFDTPTTAQTLGLLDNDLGYLVPNLISMRETIGDLISRPYFPFIFVFLFVFGLVIVNRETSGRRVAGVGFVAMTASTSMAILLEARFGRMPYRLVMPLWVLNVLMILTFTSKALTKPNSEQLSASPMVVNGTTTVAKRNRTFTSICLIAGLLFGALGIRYAAFAWERQSEAVRAVENRTPTWDCLRQEQRLIFRDVLYGELGFGGDYVSAANESYFKMKIIDTGWLLHTEPFRKRVRQWGIDPDQSLIQSLVDMNALFVTSPETMSLLAKLFESKTPHVTATPQLTEVCGVEVWKILVAPLEDYPK